MFKTDNRFIIIYIDSHTARYDNDNNKKFEPQNLTHNDPFIVDWEDEGYV